MVAATWSEKFDLNEETSIISDSLVTKGFGDIDGDTVLKCLSAIHNDGVKKDQVLSLRKLSRAEMDDLVSKTKESLLKTVDILTTEFGIYSWDFLPYEAYAIVLCYVFAHRSRITPEETKRLRRWFWTSAFTERYRDASEHYVSKDLEQIESFILDSESSMTFGLVPSANELIKLSFRANNSRSRAFILLLAKCLPQNITNGTFIDPSDALSIFNKKQFHHIYPKAHLKRTENTDLQNSLLNICMLAASENNWISDQSPQDYLPLLISSLSDSAPRVFNSNLLPDPSTFDYARSTFEQFLDQRAGIVHPVIMRLCEGDII